MDGGLAILVPVAKLLPPELLREDLFGALKALGDFGLRSRQHLVVAEAVHVAHLEAVDEHPVEAGEVVGAPLEGGGMRLLEVARHRAREVHGVLLPGSWPWRVEAGFRSGDRRAHLASPLSNRLGPGGADRLKWRGSARGGTQRLSTRECVRRVRDRPAAVAAELARARPSPIVRPGPAGRCLDHGKELVDIESPSFRGRRPPCARRLHRDRTLTAFLPRSRRTSRDPCTPHLPVVQPSRSYPARTPPAAHPSLLRPDGCGPTRCTVPSIGVAAPRPGHRRRAVRTAHRIHHHRRLHCSGFDPSRTSALRGTRRPFGVLQRAERDGNDLVAARRQRPVPLVRSEK